MKKIFKITAVIVAVVLVVAFVAPMALRGKIAAIVKREANAMLRAKLDFEEFDISLLRHFPNASLELKGLTLTGVDRFEGDTILGAKRISVVVDLMSLFGDEGLEVSKVFVASPSVHARKLADGAVNWDVIKPSEEEPAEKSSRDEKPSSFRLSVRDVRVTDAAIRFEDDSTQMSFVTAPASLRLKGDLSESTTDLDLELELRGLGFSANGIPLLSGAEAALDAVIGADLAKNRYTFSENKLRLNAIELSLDGWVELQDDKMAVDLRAGCDKVQFKELLSLIPAFYTRDFRGLTASGELSMALWIKGEAQGVKLPAFELKTEVDRGSFQYSSLPKAVTDINIALRIANSGGVMDRTVVDLSKFAFQMAGNSASATLHATNLVSDPLVKAAVQGNIDLSAVKQVYPLEKGTDLSGRIMADVKVSARMSDIDHRRYEQIVANGTFVVENLDLGMTDLPPVHIRRAAATITPATMTLGDFGITMGRSDLTATGQLTGYIGYLLRGDLLSGRLYVKSDLLDLNEIMDTTPADASETTAEPEATFVRALEVPRNLSLSLNTELQKVLFQKMTVSGIAGEMRVANGVLSLEHLRLSLFGGAATASGSYSTVVDAQRPALKMNMSLAGASFARTFDELELVQKLVPLFAKTGGDYSLSLDLATTLDGQMSPEMKSLNATGEIRSANIEIHNLEAFDALAKALNNDALRRIEAKDVAIRFAVKDGRVTTQPFDLKIGNTNLTMSGSTGLDQTIDYTAKVSLPGSAMGGVLQTVGVKIGGTFSAPKITLGVKEAAQEAVKNVIDQQIEKLTGSKTLSEEVQKQAVRLREEAKKAGAKLVEAADAQRTKLVEAAAAKGALAKIAAQKAGDKLVSEAEKQAAKLVAEAESRIEKLTAPKE